VSPTAKNLYVSLLFRSPVPTVDAPQLALVAGVSLADVIRQDSDLGGKLLVRYRIDPSGMVQRAKLADVSFLDTAFVNAVLGKVRRWTFEPLVGRTVEVIYPFVFLLPK
jgi:hypothetical protein